VVSLRARLPLAQSDARQLRIDEHGVGHQAISGRGAAALDEIAADNPKIVVGDVREGRAAFDIAQHIDARHIRLKPLVGLNEAVRIGSHARCR